MLKYTILPKPFSKVLLFTFYVFLSGDLEWHRPLCLLWQQWAPACLLLSAFLCSHDAPSGICGPASDGSRMLEVAAESLYVELCGCEHANASMCIFVTFLKRSVSLQCKYCFHWNIWEHKILFLRHNSCSTDFYMIQRSKKMICKYCQFKHQIQWMKQPHLRPRLIQAWHEGLEFYHWILKVLHNPQ